MKDKIKILLPCLGNGLVTEFSGGETRQFEFIRMLLSDGGFDITFVTTSGGYNSFLTYYHDRPDIIKKVKVVLLKASLFIKNEPFRMFRYWSNFISIIHFILKIRFGRPGDFDLAYAFSDFLFDIYPLVLMKKKKRIRVLFSSIYHRYPEPSKRKGNYFLNWLVFRLQLRSFKLISGFFDECMILDSLEGKEAGETVKSMGFPKDILFVKCGLNIDQIKEIQSGGRKRDIIHIGMRPNKGIYDLPEILRPVREKYPDIKISLIGKISEDDRVRLTKEFEKYNLAGNVEYPGMVTDEEKFKILKSARLFIAPSHEEGWGIAIGEAFACGLPVVAYDLPAYHSVYGDSVDYCPGFDKKLFAGKILELLEAPGLYKKYQNAGLERIQSYNWDKLFNEELELIRKYCKS